jgi:threonine/homoserine/homoserine lactone efflux protein
MTLEHLLPLIGFVAVMSGTPGPNNLMLMAAGANVGWRPCLPHLLGIAFGCQALLWSLALGLGGLLAHYPALNWGLRFATTRARPGEQRAARPLTFSQAALFQAVNPKAWMMMVTALATFTGPSRFVADVALVSLCYLLVGLPLISTWNLGGVVLKARLHQGRRLRHFNQVMALLLLALLYPVFFSADAPPLPAPAATPPQWWLSVM